MPSPALARRIKRAGEAGPLVVRNINNTPGAPPSMANRAEVIRTNGTQPSEPERIRVLGLLAADDAEPFT